MSTQQNLFSKTDTVALIPAYEEARFIGEVVKRILATQTVDQVIVIDDGSKDQTASCAREAGAYVIVHSVNQGKGKTLQTGFDYILNQTSYHYIVMLDGDKQHLPEEIPLFTTAANTHSNIELFIGNRMHSLEKMPWLRRITNQTMSWLISLVCQQSITDTQCGFRLVKRELLPSLLQCSGGFDYDTEMLLITSFQNKKIINVPISTIYGDETSSIHPVRDTLRFIRLMLRYALLERKKLQRIKDSNVASLSRTNVVSLPPTNIANLNRSELRVPMK